MNRKSLFGRLAPRIGNQTAERPNCFHACCEPLEERQLLSATRLLVSTYDNTNGNSVLSYDQAFAPAAGSVATGDHGLGTAQGLVVAPDGSFYVSSDSAFPGAVLHYSDSGTYLGTLGAGDANPVTAVSSFFSPGTLVFGPNGHLYVGDLAGGSIHQFDTTSLTQQYLSTLQLGYAPGGFAFAPDISHDLIVGGVETGGVIEYHSDNTTTTLIPDSPNIHPLAILPEANGNLLIADSSLAPNATDHHQILLYNVNVSPHTTSQFINLTVPVGTGPSSGAAPQPTALAYDQDGNLLVGVSPDHNLEAAIEKFNITDGSMISTLVSNIGTPTGMAFTPPASSVASRLLFYNQSAFDGNTAGVDPLDDAAISNKVAYLPGGAASTNAATSFPHESNYTKGINGLMVDLTAGGTHGSITSSDFVFRVGVNDGMGGIAFSDATPGQLPTTISMRAGAGAGGSDRVEMIFANNVLRNVWLEVQVKADANTAIAQNGNYPIGIGDVFFFANKAGDTSNDNGGSYISNATDQLRIRLNSGAGVGVNNTFDVNKDGNVNATDQLGARINSGSLPWFSNTVTGPFAPDAGPLAPSASPAASAAPASSLSIADLLSAAQDSALASGITGLLNNLPTSVPPWLQSRLVNVLDSAPVVKILRTLASHNSAVDRIILTTIDGLADKFNLHDDVLDGILADMGLE